MEFIIGSLILKGISDSWNDLVFVHRPCTDFFKKTTTGAVGEFAVSATLKCNIVVHLCSECF